MSYFESEFMSDFESEFEVKVWPKKLVQDVLKDFRQAGFTVKKVSDGIYKVTEDGEVIMHAMKGQAEYLCRVRKGTFSY